MSIRPRSVRLALLAVLAGSLLSATAWSATVAQDPSLSTGSPATAPADLVPLPSADSADGATPLLPDPTNFGGLPTTWDRITVGPDGRTLMVYFTGGVDGCYGLKSVTTSTVDGVTTISLEMGRRQDAMGKLCIQATQSYKTPVVLDAPILGGGVGS